MVSCSLADCEITKRNNPSKYTFHRLPKNPALREKWLRIINRPDWVPSMNSCICSKHFESKCFVQRERRRVLLADSIPTLFVPIKLPKRRLASSYVNREIFLPSGVVTPPPLAEPGMSNQALLSRTKRLIASNTLLKQKILKKNTIIRNLRAKTKRMSKQLLEIAKQIRLQKAGLQNHVNSSISMSNTNVVDFECHQNLIENLVLGL